MTGNASPLFRTLSRIAARIREDRTQILTCALGIAGAALVAQTRTPSLMLAGFACWSISNLLLAGIAWRAGQPWVAGMFGVYEVTALVGLANTAGLVLG
jgi:hypothetical protein